MTLYQEIAGILVASAILGIVAVRLKQPLIIVYMAVGILVGPAFLGGVSSEEPLALLAEIGITVLLFVVGLKLDMKLVRTLGPVALATGLGQLAFTIVFGFLICLARGLELIEALYVAVALTFSSTIIVVKLLSDKREIDSLHGRIAMGFLIVQDIAVVLAMLLLSVYGAELEDNGALPAWTVLLLKIVAAGVGLTVFMKLVLPRLTQSVARTPELLMLFAIAWGTLLAAVATELGLTKEVGAFLAGSSLASTPVRDAIASRLTSLRDFLLLFFFVHLGAQLDFDHIGHDLVSAGILSAFVLIGNPLIVMAIMGFMGYRKRTGFMAGLTVAQISEFSIIFVAMGIGLGHVETGVLGLTTLVGMVTITLSTYMILFSQPLYERLSRFLGVFERAVPHREDAETCAEVDGNLPVVVFGLGRYGRRLAHHLIGAGREVIGVDFDPEAVELATKQGITAYYGDAEDTEYVQHLPLAAAPWVVSTVPDVEITDALVRALAEGGYRGRVAVSAFHEGDADRLESHGVHLVFHPYTDAAEMAARHLLRELPPVATARAAVPT